MLPLLLLLYPQLIYRDKRKIRISFILISLTIVLLYPPILFIEKILDASIRFPLILIDTRSISSIKNLNIMSRAP